MKPKNSFQKTIDILTPFAVYYLVFMVAQELLLWLLQLTLKEFGEAYRAFITARSGAVQGIMMGLCILTGLLTIVGAAKREIRLSVREQAENFPQRFEKYILSGLLAAASALGINGLLAMTGLAGHSAAYTEVAERQLGIPLGVGLVVFGIISPLAEEVLFRGIIYNRMKKYFPPMVAVIVSSLLFGAYHGNLVQGIYASIMGLLIVFVYEQYQSFTVAVFFHGMANIVVFYAAFHRESYKIVIGPVMCAVFLAAAMGLFIYIRFLAGKKNYQ